VVDLLNIHDLESSFFMSQSNEAELEIKGLVFDIKKYAIHDGPGIRTTVFFKGCPLECKWCHNPESWRAYPELSFRKSRCVACGQCIENCPEQAISIINNRPVTDVNKCNLCGRCVDTCINRAREIIGREMTVNDVIEEIEQDIIFYDQSEGGVTFSGGEPLMQPEFLIAVLNQCQRQRIHTAVDTSCYAESKIVETVGERADLFLCDIKHMDSKIHEKFTGVGNRLILDNISYLSAAGKQIIIRIPVIPDFNNDKANIEATGKFIASLPGVVRVDILPFNRGGKEKSTRLASQNKYPQIEPPSEEQMNLIAKDLSKYGLEVKIRG
jgi:pyruvate formate lyase activating enzyme